MRYAVDREKPLRLTENVGGGRAGVAERRHETGASERAIRIGRDAFARRLHGAIALRVAQEVLAPALELELHARFRESFGDVGRRVIEIARRYGWNRLAHLGIALENEIRVDRDSVRRASRRTDHDLVRPKHLAL